MVSNIISSKYTKHKRSFDTDLEVVSNEFNYFYEFFHGLGEFIGSHKIVAVLLIATWVVFVVISNH